MTVQNEQDNPVPVEVTNQENVREPYSVYYSAGRQENVTINFPSDKIFVVEEVNSSIDCFDEFDFAGRSARLSFGAKESSESTTRGLLRWERYNATDSARKINAKFSGRLYAFPTTSIQVSWLDDPSGGTPDDARGDVILSISVLISGYLIPADS